MKIKFIGKNAHLQNVPDSSLMKKDASNAIHADTQNVRNKNKKIAENAVIPKYAHYGDAGFDLHSTGEYIVKPKETAIVKTGIQIEIPNGYFGSIRDRSGLAVKHSIHTLAGVVDSGYRGEVKVALINLGEIEFIIREKDRIAQMIIHPYEFCNFREVEDISETSRGDGGFGSSGKK